MFGADGASAAIAHAAAVTAQRAAGRRAESERSSGCSRTANEGVWMSTPKENGPLNHRITRAGYRKKKIIGRSTASSNTGGSAARERPLGLVKRSKSRRPRRAGCRTAASSGPLSAPRRSSTRAAGSRARAMMVDITDRRHPEEAAARGQGARRRDPRRVPTASSRWTTDWRSYVNSPRAHVGRVGMPSPQEGTDVLKAAATESSALLRAPEAYGETSRSRLFESLRALARSPDYPPRGLSCLPT